MFVGRMSFEPLKTEDQQSTCWESKGAAASSRMICAGARLMQYSGQNHQFCKVKFQSRRVPKDEE